MTTMERRALTHILAIALNKAGYKLLCHSVKRETELERIKPYILLLINAAPDNKRDKLINHFNELGVMG